MTRQRIAPLLALLLAVSCSTMDDDSSPEGALKVFVQAVKNRNQEEVMTTLSSDSKKPLQDIIKSLKAKGQTKITVGDLLIPQGSDLEGGQLTRLREEEERYALWESVVTRTFPGSVSNHHLGTLLGLLMAAYEMNRFKDEYQPRVIANARAFAQALSDCGLDVAGDPEEGFTETHQVVLHVGYGKGPEAASALEESNIICNYQATPEEEGFTASGALRMGVAEMTRFGMGESDFQELAELIRDVLTQGADARERVRKLRDRHLELRYCFQEAELDPWVEKLHGLVRSA